MTVVDATPLAKETMKPRMLVVYGSQTGTCKRFAGKMAESWKQRGIVESLDLKEGNEIAHEMDDIGTLKSSYDVLVVVTSSYGDGDPPDNFDTFLLKCLEGAESGSKPLAGMQHAVLGEGSSVYRETFQNCPRLTDKHLEACGSRRFVARHETDVGGEEDESISRSLFREAVWAAISEGLPPASDPAAAVWNKPRFSHDMDPNIIVAKTASDLGRAQGQSVGQLLVPFFGLLLGAGAYYYYTYVETE